MKNVNSTSDEIISVCGSNPTSPNSNIPLSKVMLGSSLRLYKMKTHNVDFTVLRDVLSLKLFALKCLRSSHFTMH